MNQLNPNHTSKNTPPRTVLPVLGKLVSAYKLWQQYLVNFPKTSRYSLGNKIDILFVEAIETVSIAAFLAKAEKIPYVRKSISKLDTLKVFLQIAWEIKVVDMKKYIALSEILSEAGRMLGGWHNQLIKQNSPAQKAGEK